MASRLGGHVRNEAFADALDDLITLRNAIEVCRALGFVTLARGFGRRGQTGVGTRKRVMTRCVSGLTSKMSYK